jgi:phosphatidylglycerophosphate synthase
MAARLPARVNPDHLTALGFLALLGAGAAYAAASVFPKAGLSVAIACLVLNWFGDSLDGTVARVRRQQRPRYGFYVDHILDSIGTVVLFAGIACSGLMSFPAAAVLLVAYLLVSIEVFLATYTVGRFQLSFGGFGPTELRLLLITGNFFAMRRADATLFGYTWRLFDIGAACGIVGLVAVLVISATRHTALLYREETPWR